MVDQCEASPPRGTNPFNLRHVDGGRWGVANPIAEFEGSAGVGCGVGYISGLLDVQFQ